MLKITRIGGIDFSRDLPREPDVTDHITLVVEGRIVGAWIEELQQECTACLDHTATLKLDLSGVQFVAAEGVAMLKTVLKEAQQLGLEVQLLGCSLFVSRVLSQNSVSPSLL